MMSTVNKQVIIRAKQAPDFVVDRSKGTLINTNKKELEAYKSRRTQLRKNKELSQRVDALEHKLELAIQLLSQQNNQQI